MRLIKQRQVLISDARVYFVQLINPSTYTDDIGGSLGNSGSHLANLRECRNLNVFQHWLEQGATTDRLNFGYISSTVPGTHAHTTRFAKDNRREPMRCGFCFNQRRRCPLTHAQRYLSKCVVECIVPLAIINEMKPGKIMNWKFKWKVECKRRIRGHW